MNYVRATLLICALGTASIGHAQDYAAWKTVNKDGSWTLIAESAVKGTKLVALAPKDITDFCPAYSQLDADKRLHFWVGLLSAMAKPESGFKPETKYVEPDILDANKQNVVSRGLLQISMESANQKAYGCGIQQAEDLHRVDVNLNCAARIMQHWVEKDERVAAMSKPAVGAARYWSVLRAWRGHLDEIAGFTKGMQVCKL
ncbi:MAG TPA: transglycosylase SLT domain-containing protein [Pseudomonas sp.]|nr:transglycosylase SLT domain-containing protein [Pseudomonas sp.]